MTQEPEENEDEYGADPMTSSTAAGTRRIVNWPTSVCRAIYLNFTAVFSYEVTDEFILSRKR